MDYHHVSNLIYKGRAARTLTPLPKIVRSTRPILGECKGQQAYVQWQTSPWKHRLIDHGRLQRQVSLMRLICYEGE